jgi:putative membrane protein
VEAVMFKESTLDDRLHDKSSGERDPRLRLAAERTFLAWIRTGLAMMGFGFVVARFGLFLNELAAVEHRPIERSSTLSHWVGTALIGLGVCVNLLSALEYRIFLKRYEKGEPDRVPRWSLGLVTAALMSAMGVGLIGYLFYL